MAAEERWYFTKEELNNSPSRRCGIDAEKELSYRQQGANLIQDMGQRLQVYPFVLLFCAVTLATHVKCHCALLRPFPPVLFISQASIVTVYYVLVRRDPAWCRIREYC